MKKIALIAALIAAPFTAQAYDITHADIKETNEALQQLQGVMTDDITRIDSAYMTVINGVAQVNFSSAILVDMTDQEIATMKANMSKYMTQKCAQERENHKTLLAADNIDAVAVKYSYIDTAMSTFSLTQTCITE